MARTANRCPGAPGASGLLKPEAGWESCTGRPSWGRGLEGGGPRSLRFLLPSPPRGGHRGYLSGGGPAATPPPPPPPSPPFKKPLRYPSQHRAPAAPRSARSALSPTHSLDIMRPSSRAPVLLHLLLLRLLLRPEWLSSRQAAALLSRAQTGPSRRDLSDS